MVGIALFPSEILVPKPQANRNGASPVPLCYRTSGAFGCSGTPTSRAGIHALKDLLRLLALAVCLSALDARARWQIPGWRSRPTVKVAPLYRPRVGTSRILCQKCARGRTGFPGFPLARVHSLYRRSAALRPAHGSRDEGPRRPAGGRVVDRPSTCIGSAGASARAAGCSRASAAQRKGISDA